MARFSRRSQITAFVIVGLILVISISSFIYIRSNTNGPGSTPPDVLDLPIDEASMKSYVESCMSQVAGKVIPQIAGNGGLLNMYDDQEEIFVWYDDKKFRIYCNHVEGVKACQNAFIMRQDIELEIEKELPSLMEKCLNFDSFRAQGNKVEPGDMSFNVKLGVSDITITLDYPIAFTVKGNKIMVNNYYSRIPSNLGFMYELALSITNYEIEKGYFDKDQWMVDNNVFIDIEKHKPYPHIIYSLKKNDPDIDESLEFRFSLQGEDTSVSVGSAPTVLSIGKDCINSYDTKCFKNVKREACLEKKGQVTKCALESVSPRKKPDDCNGHPCKPCIYNGNSTPHGSSWCLYDSVQKINSYGLAYVGSRQFLQSCIDGNVVTEECRDFREEMCTQNIVQGNVKGLCRINRWQDCPFCNTESCCMDESKRDCQWDDKMYKYLDGSRVEIQYPERKCFPKVPPGFRFWDGYGMDVCNMGTQYAYCKGWGACPGSYVDDSALYCLRLGDCGNFRNIADRLTTTGFFNSDPSDKVSNFIMLSPGMNKDPVSQLGTEPITSNLYATNQQLLVNQYPESIEVLPALMQQAVLYLKYVKKISPNPITLAQLDPKVLEYSFCTAWTPPEGSQDCSFCSIDPKKPCSEYRCKSLGANCKFESIKGVGYCTPMNTDDNKPPEIIFDNSALQQGFEAEPATISPAGFTINGYKISPSVKPYLPFSFGIKTDEPARCKLTFIPGIDYSHLPAIWIGSSKYEKDHAMSFRFPRDLSVPSRVYKYLDIQSLSEVVDLVTNLRETYDRYKEKYKTEIALFEMIRGIDVTKMADAAVDRILATIEPFIDKFPFIKELAKIMLSNFEDNRYMLFVKCIDEAGNYNTQEFFIDFQIDVNAVDDYPVIFLGSDPSNNSDIRADASNFTLSYFINEPAECHYDFVDTEYEIMAYSLECPYDPMDVSFMYKNSYECKGTIPFPTEKSNESIFVRCLDNPPFMDKYSLTFTKGNNFSIPYQAPYFEYISPNTVNIDADLLDNIKLNVSTDTVFLNFYIDDDMECKFMNNNSQGNYAPFACISYNVTDLGMFKCSAVIPTMHNSSNIMIECLKKTLPSRNVDKASTMLNFYRSQKLSDLVAETAIIRVGDTIYSTTDQIPSTTLSIGLVLRASITENNIICAYYEGAVETPDTEMTTMIRYNDFSYEADLSSLSEGPHTYTIKCWDGIGNMIKEPVNFKVKTT